MSNALFPELPGLEWDLSKAPMFNTKIMTSINGRELRASFQSFPKYEISLSFGFLRERSGNEPYRVCRRPLFLRECPDEKSKIHP